MKKEYIVNRSSVITLNVTAGKIDSFRKTEETTGTVRVYEDGKIGIAGMIGEPNEAELTSKASSSLSFGIPYVENLDGELKESHDNSCEIIKEKNFIPTMQNILDKVGEVCPNFAISNKIMLMKESREYHNSNGRELKWADSAFNLGLVFQDKTAGNIMDGFYETSGRSINEKEIVEQCKIFHDAFFNKFDLDFDGEATVVFTPYSLLSTFLRNFVGELYVAGASLVSGKLNEKCFADNLTLSIDRNPETSLCNPFFDAEGQIAKDYRVPIIENGVLKNLLATKQTMAQYGIPAAGTASSAYDGVPSIGIPGIRITPTAENLAELVPGKSILVIMASGGDTTPQGHFATPVQCAFLLDNGKPVGRLPEITVSGDFFDLFGKNWVGTVEKDPQPDSSYCAVKMTVSKQ